MSNKDNWCERDDCSDGFTDCHDCSVFIIHQVREERLDNLCGYYRELDKQDD